MQRLMLAIGIVLIATSCTGMPEKSFVYKLDGMGQVSCNRGEEKSALQQTVEGVAPILRLLTLLALFEALPGGDEGKKSDEILSSNGDGVTDKMKYEKLESVYNDCRRMNGLE